VLSQAFQSVITNAQFPLALTADGAAAAQNAANALSDEAEEALRTIAGTLKAWNTDDGDDDGDGDGEGEGDEDDDAVAETLAADGTDDADAAAGSAADGASGSASSSAASAGAGAKG
jgi:hypothetical protein